MKNNNKKVIAHLAKKQYDADKKRHMILMGAVAFAVMALFCVFSFAAGKFETDMLREARKRGVVSNTRLERATEEQYEQIQELSYIKDVGRCVWFGVMSEARCAVIDDVTWEKIKKPAFTDIHGNYPRGKREVMLPVRALEAIGITDPQVGMKLSFPVGFLDESKEVEVFDFVLSGYYTEYIATAQYGRPDAYFSQSFLDSVPGKEELDLTLYLRQDDRLKGITVEQRLYQDIEMRDTSQKFFVSDTAGCQAMFVLAGGVDTILILAVVILTSVGLLIYNVLHISFERSIREYGLLKTLGTTKRQICSIVYWQMRRIVLRGSVIGALMGVVIALVVIPVLLSKMYLHRFGSASGMITFRPILLAASFLFCGVVAYFSSSLAIRRTVKLTPIEAVTYMDQAASGDGWKDVTKVNRKQKFLLTHMAWRSIMRFKRRYFVSAACLSLGLIASLAVVMISRGADTSNQIEYEHPDIHVGTLLGPEVCQEFNRHILFPNEILAQILALPGIEKSTISRGGFGEILVDEPVFDLIRDNMETDFYFYRSPCTIQILSDEYLTQLKAIAKEQELYLDVETVIDGDGMILLHDHLLSPAQIEMSKNTVGMPLKIYDIVYGQQARHMRFCGYLDLQLEKLPDIQCTARFDDLVYLLTSEKGFQKLQIEEQNFCVSLKAQSGSRLDLGREVKKIVEKYNEQYKPDPYGNEDQRSLSIVLKNDILQEMSDYINSNRLVMGALCVILLLMGIVNYVDVTITGLTVRTREFAVMESIGLTRKQLKNMLLLEGVFYSLIITALTAGLGGGIFFLTGRGMQERMEYFVIQYPVLEFTACVAALFLLCIGIVLVLYRGYGDESISLRVQRNN